jgi:hypothetical protein
MQGVESYPDRTESRETIMGTHPNQGMRFAVSLACRVDYWRTVVDPDDILAARDAGKLRGRGIERGKCQIGVTPNLNRRAAGSGFVEQLGVQQPPGVEGP